MGLAYLIKTVILIAIPSLVVVFLIEIFIRKRLNAKKALVYAFGIILPVFFFEIYKYSCLKKDNYVIWWKNQLSSILNQAGVSDGYSDTINLFDKTQLHLKILGDTLGFNQFILIIVLLVPYFDFIGFSHQ